MFPTVDNDATNVARSENLIGVSRLSESSCGPHTHTHMSVSFGIERGAQRRNAPGYFALLSVALLR